MTSRRPGLPGFEPRANPNHLAHQVDAVALFGDRMLNLQTRVHLKEVELTLRVQELDRSRADIANLTRQTAG